MCVCVCLGGACVYVYACARVCVRMCVYKCTQPLICIYNSIFVVMVFVVGDEFSDPSSNH